MQFSTNEQGVGKIILKKNGITTLEKCGCKTWVNY